MGSGTKHRTADGTRQRRIAEAVRKHPEKSVVSLAHHIDMEWMYGAYQLTRRHGAKGIDGVGAEEYQKGDLWRTLQSLKEGRCRPDNEGTLAPFCTVWINHTSAKDQAGRLHQAGRKQS